MLFEILQQLVTDYTLRTVSLGAALLGVVSGTLGSFAMLRKQSLLGDAISHAALPGIALAFLLTGSKSPIVLLMGAAVAGWLGTLKVMSIVKHTRIKLDTALGIVLSVFFGAGLVLLTFIQKLPNANQSGLDKFLFGQAATLLAGDVVVMAVLGIPSLVIMAFLWKELKILSFDPDFAEIQGFPVRTLDILLTTLIVISIVIGLQTVGVVLMSAMIVAPAAAARQWTDRLGVMVFLAGLFGAISGVAGAVISSLTTKLPTGPTIVLVMSGIVVVSLLFAPNRGLVWAWIRQKRNQRRLQVGAILEDLYLLSLQHAEARHPHPTATLQAMSHGHGGVNRTLEELSKMGYVQKIVQESWSLTPEGEAAAKNLAKTTGGRNDSSN